MSFDPNKFSAPIQNGYDKLHSLFSYKITVENGKGFDILGPFSGKRNKRISGRSAGVELDGRYILLSTSHEDDEVAIFFPNKDVDSFKKLKEAIDDGTIYYNHCIIIKSRYNDDGTEIDLDALREDIYNELDEIYSSEDE